MQTQVAERVGTTPAGAKQGFGWVKLVALGGAIAAIGPAIPQLIEGFEPFLAILMAPILVGLALLRFFRKTGIVWLGVVSLALLVMNAPFAADALIHPESPADFVPVTMLTVGGLLTVIATIPAFKTARGRHSDSGFPKIAAVTGVVVVVAAIAGSLAARAMVTDDALTAGSLVVDMENFEFGPGLHHGAAPARSACT